MIAKIIAVVSLAIALISAMYARRSAAAAKQANKIAIHQERLKIYKALLAHISNISARGVAISSEEVWEFYEPATLAKFYFDSGYAKRLEKLFDDSLELVTKKAEWDDIRDNEPAAYQALVQETHKLHRATRDGARKLAEEIEPALVINEA